MRGVSSDPVAGTIRARRCRSQLPAHRLSKPTSNREADDAVDRHEAVRGPRRAIDRRTPPTTAPKPSLPRRRANPALPTRRSASHRRRRYRRASRGSRRHWRSPTATRWPMVAGDATGGTSVLLQPTATSARARARTPPATPGRRAVSRRGRTVRGWTERERTCRHRRGRRRSTRSRAGRPGR